MTGGPGVEPAPPGARVRRTAPHSAAFLAGYSLLAICWTWPLAARLSWRIPHDPGDPLLVTWIMWWNTQAVPLTSAWWDAPLFFPLRGAFALSEHLLGMALFTTPIQLAGGSPLFAYNIVLLLSYALSGFFSFLLVRQLTGSAAVGFCAGMAYAFAPYRASQLSHLQVLTSQWMPLALYALHRYLATGRRRLLAVFGAATLIQGLSHGYNLFFFPVLLVCWMAWFIDWRRTPRRAVTIAAAWVISSLPLVPILWTYREVQNGLGLYRPLSEIRLYSANVRDFLSIPPLLRFWRDVYAKTSENYLFPGVTVVVLVTAGISTIARRGVLRRAFVTRSPFAFYVCATLLMYSFAMGPAPADAGWRALAHPYTLLTWIPGFHGLRVAARFTMLAVLCFTTAAGLALARLTRGRPRLRAVLVAIACVGVVIDGAIEPMPLGAPPGRLDLPEVPGAAVLELPADDARVSIAAMYRGISHRRPVINGYSGYTPPHYTIFGEATRRNDPSPILELARSRPLIIIVSDRYDSEGKFRRLVEGLPSIERHGSGTGGAKYVLPPQPRKPLHAVGPAWPFTLQELPRTHVVLDLGSTRVIRLVEFALRKNYARLGEKVEIETSMDGQIWTSAWANWIGGLAVAGALDDPIRVPVRIMLPDVTARFLRIHPAPSWMWEELVVRGPG